MSRKETKVQKIVRLTVGRYPELQKRVSVEELVRFVLAKRNVLERREQAKIGDDARDYMNNAYLINSLSDKDLGVILNLKFSEIGKKLKNKTYPFAFIDSDYRDKLLHIPPRWIHGSAKWLLETRKWFAD